jgi:glycosyltransferase involved in cell wall biosynthesis
LLRDLLLPEAWRVVTFSANEARVGVLPGAIPFDGAGLLDGNPSVLCLLGAAWVQRDYFHRILFFKRKFGTKFVLLMHDLIPIYARETCDQGTARVFEEFMRRATRHADHYLSVSEHTAKDLKRYVTSLGLPEPNVTVTRNGSSFDEFSPKDGYLGEIRPEDVPTRFVLFVATIEGRKNHRLLLELWRRMIEEGDDPPDLVCVGRVGWKSDAFVAELVETDHLNGKVLLLKEVSDAYLKLLYRRCLFTVFPSLYEGWGLPVGESLAAGKICVSSNRSSIPEVAGELGLYIDIDDPDQALTVIRRVISDTGFRKKLETKIRREYKPVMWRSVAQAVVAGCKEALKVEWQDPYPYAAIPYSAEVSFSWLGRDSDSGTFGDDMLARIVDTRKGYFLHDPLQEQSFFRGESARGGGAWAEPENWGTWLCHSGGEIVLGLAQNKSSHYYVFLRLRASGSLSNVSIRISANGELVWEGSIGDRSRNIPLRIRRRIVAADKTAATKLGGWWRLRLRVDAQLSAEQRAQLAAVDSRVPTLGFERLVVVPEDDLKTRVDILYKLLS